MLSKNVSSMHFQKCFHGLKFVCLFVCLFLCLFVLVVSAVPGPNTKVCSLIFKRIAIHYVHHILPESCALGVAVVNCT